jgi:hypothetical protein
LFWECPAPWELTYSLLILHLEGFTEAKKEKRKKSDPLKDSMDYCPSRSRTSKFTIMCYGMVKIEHILPVKCGNLVSILGQENVFERALIIHPEPSFSFALNL